MGQLFSNKTAEGIRLLWKQYDRDEMLRGAQLLGEAAEEGDAEALSCLARCYMGEPYIWKYSGFECNYDKASCLLLESIQRGSACGVLIAARRKEFTPSIRQSMPFSTLQEARDIILRQAEAGEPFCQYIIGNTYYFGDIIQIDSIDDSDFASPEDMAKTLVSKSIPWYEKAVEGGVNCAAKPLYLLYGGQHGVETDRKKQWELARHCAGRGDPYWEETLAGIYEGQADMRAKALEWYTRAASHGQISSWLKVGQCYENGIGTEKDLKEAANAYLNGAQEGDPGAQCSLGRLYFYGAGIRQNYKEAAYWLEQAAEQNYSSVYYLLGQCYLKGYGVESDYGKARSLFDSITDEASAGPDEDYPDPTALGVALNGLGELYSDGLLGVSDIYLGIEYFERAAALGNEDAKQNLQQFKRGLFGRWSRR